MIRLFLDSGNCGGLQLEESLFQINWPADAVICDVFSQNQSEVANIYFRIILLSKRVNHELHITF